MGVKKIRGLDGSMCDWGDCNSLRGSMACVEYHNKNRLGLMSERKLICGKCGEIPHIFINGGEVEEKLLEDVMFKASIDARKKYYHAEVTEEDEEYFEQFNKDMWLQTVEEYASELDTAQCPKCHTKIVMPK